MTAPRIIPAAEAAALLEGATPGPWVHNSGDLWHTGGCGGPLTREADWALAAIAPDLATSVVALHAQVARLTSDDHALARRIADAAIAAERERIVAWLRDFDPAWADQYWTPVRQGLRYAADRIEAGAHVAEVKP